MKILYLCDKTFHDTKMSRVRFDAMEAVSKISDFVYSGNGFDNYDSQKTVQENLIKIYGADQPDLIVVYKPNMVKGLSEVSIPKCISYNEMWNINECTQEITQNKIQLVVAHHKNDIPKYTHIKDVKFVNISHCANSGIYKDYGMDKTNDVLISGAIGLHYPFRHRLLCIMANRLSQLCRCKHLPHPGGDIRDLHGLVGEDYAKEINSSKITLTCSSKHRYRLGKYVEIPMCASTMAGDLPDEDQWFFKKFMLVLDPNYSDDVIVDKIMYYVNNDKERNEKIRLGVELNKEYTQDKYAERFISEMHIFIAENKK